MARILVIDDESNIRMMLRLALTPAGHTVDTAADGYEGLEKWGEDGSGYQLVLLDQRMPGIEGLDVLREIRRRTPEARVILITAFGTFDLASEAMRAGATEFLRKPFTIETLRNAVTAALAVNAPRTVFAPDEPLPVVFDRAAVNGFRVRTDPGITTGKDGGIADTFVVTGVDGTETTCHVVLPPYLVELVKAHADREEMPGGDRFWQSLCGEALANYLWQNAETPPGNELLVDDLTGGLRHWMDAVLSGND